MTFIPRYDAQARRYRYRLFCQPVRHPLRERYAWRVWPPVDRSPGAACGLSARNARFCCLWHPAPAGGSTVRHVLTRAEWIACLADELIFEIDANAFLFRMVRRLVGFPGRNRAGSGSSRKQLAECLESGPQAAGEIAWRRRMA